MVFNLPKQYQHFQRYRKITQILLKNGLGILVDWLELDKYLPFKERLNRDENSLNKKSFAARVRQVLQELGPTYIKFGQLLSTRADILPPVYIKELRKLQDKAEHLSFSDMERVLIEELGDHYQEKFLKINKKPQATASIAQTHRAKLKDGSDVILKIQRPGIEKSIKTDLQILANLAGLATEKGLFPPFFKTDRLINEFKESLQKELDFKRELSNMNKFAANFGQNEFVIIPTVYEELSGKKLLVLEEIKGIKLSEIDELLNPDIDAAFIAEIGAKALMQQILLDGFFHADPHPGNIFIVDRNKLAYIDFGLMGQLTAEDRDRMGILFVAVLKKDIDIVVDILIDIGDLDPNLNIRKFKLEIQDWFNRYYGAGLAEIDFLGIIDDLERLLYNLKIRMPEEFFLLFRAIAVSQGVAYKLDPNFNIIEVANDFLIELLINRFQPKKLFSRLLNKLWDYRHATKDIPGRVSKIINKVISDDLTINFKHKNLEGLSNQLDIVSNRLSISMIISALIIGSSMIIQTDMKPVLFGIPLLGFLGYSVAGIMGLFLVISIFKSGRF